MKMSFASQQEEIAKLKLLVNVTEKVNDLEDDLDEHGDRIDNLHEETNGLESLVTTRLDAQTSRIDTVQNYSQQVNKEMQDLRILVQGQAAEISEMKRLNTIKDQQIQDLMSLMSAQTKQVQGLAAETNNKIEDIAFTQTSQEMRINSLAQNSTEEDAVIKQRIEEHSLRFDELKEGVDGTIEDLEMSVQAAMTEQIQREEAINTDITIVKENITENTQYIQNIYLELMESLSMLRSRIEMQERTMVNFFNETKEPEEKNNVIETMSPSGPTLEDLEELRMRLSTHEGLVSNLNSSVRNQLTLIQGRFNSLVMNMNASLRTELAEVVLSIPQGASVVF